MAKTPVPIKRNMMFQHQLVYQRLDLYAARVLRGVVGQHTVILGHYLNQHKRGRSTPEQAVRGLNLLFERQMKPLIVTAFRTIYRRCGEEAEEFLSSWLKGGTQKAAWQPVALTAAVDGSWTGVEYERVRKQSWLEHVNDYMEDKAGKNIGKMSDDEQTMVSNLLYGGAQEEAGSIESVPSILASFSDMAESRATAIARTEVTGAYNYAGLQTAQDMVPGWYKEWNAEIDEKTRDWHKDLDGADPIPMDQPFENEYGNIMYPGDPDAAAENVVNCRCALNYVPPPEDEGLPESAPAEGDVPEDSGGIDLSDIASLGGGLADLVGGAGGEEAAEGTAEAALAEAQAALEAGEDLTAEQEYMLTTASITGEVPSAFEPDEDYLTAVDDFKGYLGTLTPEEQATVTDYTDGGYVETNMYLRGTMPTNYPDYAAIKAKSEMLQNVLENAPKYEGTAYRGASVTMQRFDEIASLRPGDELTMKGMVSTSADVNVATNFAQMPDSGYNSVFYEIDGAKGAAVSGVTPHVDESEILMNADTKYTVTGVDKLSDSFYKVHLVMK